MSDKKSAKKPTTPKPTAEGENKGGLPTIVDADGKERPVKSGDLPREADPIIWFAIGVTWDRPLKLPHYSRVGYERVNFDGRFTAVAQLAMELYDYTMSVLRKREKRDRRAKMEKMKNGEAR